MITNNNRYPCIDCQVIMAGLGSRLLSPITKSGVIGLIPIRHSFHGSMVSLLRGTFRKCIDKFKAFFQKWFYPCNGGVFEMFGKQHPLIKINHCLLLTSFFLNDSKIGLRHGHKVILNKMCIKTISLDVLSSNLLMSQRMKSIRAVANFCNS
jgi:hypothetical protein